MQQYLNLVRKVIDEGEDRPDRTGTGRRNLFGASMEFDLTGGKLPLVTTRKVPIKNFIKETLWFLTGSESAQELKDNGCNIWNGWMVTTEDIQIFMDKFVPDDDQGRKALLQDGIANMMLGAIGPMYGSTWRNAPSSGYHTIVDTPLNEIAEDKLNDYRELYELTEGKIEGNDEPITFEKFASTLYNQSVDQLQQLIVNLKKRPFSARHIITGWIPANVPDEDYSPQINVLMRKGALPPCHMLMQFFVNKPAHEGGKLRLSCKMYQRSADLCLGVPTNSAQYAMLTMMIAHVSGMEPYRFIHEFGDVHLYMDHIEKAKIQIEREPQESPTLKLNPDVTCIYDFKEEDIVVEGYNPLEPIHYGVSI